MMHTIQLKEIEMSYEDQGNGETIVLLHGFCGSSAYWKNVIPVLSQNYRVITPDLRGHGRSEVPLDTYSMEQMADDVKHLLDELQVSDAVMFGHSLGGYVTLAFAEKYPEVLTGFSLIHSTARPDDTAGKEGRLKAIGSIEDDGIKPFIDSLIPKLFAPDPIESMLEAVEYTKQIGYQTKPEGAIHTLEGMRERLDRNHVLRTSKVPILLVAGEKDQIIPVSKTFSVEGSHITPMKLKDVGHMSMLEAPKELTAIMENFLQTL
jgi:3-oxoadipate enol-lactonase